MFLLLSHVVSWLWYLIVSIPGLCRISNFYWPFEIRVEKPIIFDRGCSYLAYVYMMYKLHRGCSYTCLVYKFERIVGKPSFSDQFEKILKRYTRVGYNMDIMRQSSCLIVNQSLFIAMVPL